MGAKHQRARSPRPLPSPAPLPPGASRPAALRDTLASLLWRCRGGAVPTKGSGSLVPRGATGRQARAVEQWGPRGGGCLGAAGFSCGGGFGSAGAAHRPYRLWSKENTGHRHGERERVHPGNRVLESSPAHSLISDALDFSASSHHQS